MPEGRDRRRLGRVARLGEAAAQIRAGSRLLVREVKELAPVPAELDLARLSREAAALGAGLAAGRWEEAEAALDRALAGPRRPARRSRFLGPALLAALLGGGLLFVLLILLPSR